jgi:hypothetical protein
MSTPTTARGALLRRAGTLLVAAALVGAPATSAFADPTASPTTSPTADAGPTASASASPSPTATASGDPTPTTSPSATTSPSPSDPAPSPSASATPTTPAVTPSTTTAPGAGLVTGDSTTVFGPRAAVGPATSSDPALLAGHYLEQQLAAGGHHFSVTFDGVDYPDHGVTADAVLALDAAGTGQTEAAAATAWLAGDVVGYVGFGDPTEIGAGSVAKLLNVAVAQGIDPTAFGGFDLLGTLTGLEKPNGRFSDVSKYPDSSNTFGQSFALIGLHRAGGTVSSNARAYLLNQQCANGGFKLYMDDAGCTTDTDADPDATAMAVQALIAIGGESTAVGDGLDYLTGLQGASGGIGGGGPTSGVNANSTGLAGQAFLAAGRTAQARAAVGYLTTLQYGCGLPAALRGGIAYDPAAFSATTTAGTSAKPADQDRRSTAQAILALAGTPLATVTAAGADALAPAPDCAATTAPTTTPSSSVDPTSSGAPTEGAGGSDPSTTVDAAATGSLAQTGTDLLAPALLGLALVVLGAVAVVASNRRRGAHA